MKSLSRRLFLRLLGAGVVFWAGAARGHPRGRAFKKALLTTDGGRKAEALFVDHDDPPAPAVLLVHGRRGLNGSQRWIASELGRRGYYVIAPSLLPDGTPKGEALNRLRDLPEEPTLDLLTSWIRWLKANFHCTGKTAVVGFGAGGAWALRAARREKVEGVVLFEPDAVGLEKALEGLETPTMAHLSAEGPETAESPGLEVYRYGAPSGFWDFLLTDYHAKADKLAWERTFTFLQRRLGGEK